VQAGMNLTHVTAETADYLHPITLPREAIYVAYKFSSRKIKASASARKEFSDLHAAPLTYSIGVEHSILKWLTYLGNFSTVYRNPQVNDLYWNPGGNIDLRPESGHSEELSFIIDLFGLKNKKSNDSSSLSLELTLYNKNLDNRIAWTPHGALWYSVNLKSVQSYGTESSIRYTRKGRAITWSGELNYAYTISENTSSSLANDESVYKQLIYVPIHKAGFNVKVIHKNTSLSFSDSFVGNRFTNTDNTSYLKSYQLASIQIDHTFTLHKVAISCMARVSNLLNESYNAVINRAEPLRNFTIGVSCQLN
jgi:iron complex outermembrane receptor protein